MSLPTADVLFSACLAPVLDSELPTQIGYAVGVPDRARESESRVSKSKFQIQLGLGRRREITQKCHGRNQTQSLSEPIVLPRLSVSRPQELATKTDGLPRS